eukprot:89384_1
MSEDVEKRQKLLKEYTSKCISTYDPPQSEEQIFRKIDNFDFSSNNYFCGHFLFSSPYTFINHILWILHPKSFHSPIQNNHFNALQTLISCGVCTSCIVFMLSKIPFQDQINLYSICLRERTFIESYPNRG